MSLRTKVLAPALLTVASLATPAAQADVMLTDLNSTVTIDPTSQAGINGWIVDGVNQLYQQWFWYRIGDSSGQSSIDTLSAPVITQITPKQVDLTYQNDQLKVEVDYTLTGGASGSHASDLGEIVRVTNVSSQAIPLRFFQYADFDLNGTESGDNVQITTAGGRGVAAQQTGLGKPTVSESSVAPFSDRFEANFYANTLNGLNSGLPYDLNNQSAAGPGDVTWAFQWNRNLNPGDTLLISKDMNIAAVPEPSPLLMAGAALLVGLGYTRFARRRPAV
jgi:hypothetical protein